MPSKKNERIERGKKENGSRKRRKLKRYSEKFETIFKFFLQSYRSGILTFCGSIVNVEFDQGGDEGKFCFRSYENGEKDWVKTRHPNVLKAVVIGKKSFGLFCDQWADGISEGSFMQDEILKEFYGKGIEIPNSLMKDFDDRIRKKRIKYLDRYLKKL